MPINFFPAIEYISGETFCVLVRLKSSDVRLRQFVFFLKMRAIFSAKYGVIFIDLFCSHLPFRRYPLPIMFFGKMWNHWSNSSPCIIHGSSHFFPPFLSLFIYMFSCRVPRQTSFNSTSPSPLYA